MRPSDLKQQLSADHQRLEQLFVQLQDAFTANAREDTQKLWSELERGLEAHFVAEERFLFPRYAQVDATETQALATEHALLRSQLAELGAGVDLKLVRAEVAQGFLDTLRAHAAREDAVLYSWANEALADEAQQVVLDALLSRKGPRRRARGSAARRASR